MTSQRVNFYDLLELDPAVDDWDLVAERIAERREHWSRQLNQGNPAKRQRAAEQLDLLRQAEELLRDPAARAEEAEACRRRRDVEREVIARRLEARIDLLIRGGGVCGRVQLHRLVEEFSAHFSRDAIVERLRAAGVEPPGRSVRPPEVRLDDAEASRIRGQLELLRLASLYELLSLPVEATPGELVRRSEELQRELHSATRADAVTTARRDLVARARKLFADEAGKLRYDNQLLYERLSPFDADIELAAGADGVLTSEQVEAIVAQAVDAGVGETDARAYVQEVAEERGWRPERRATGAAGSGEAAPAPPPRTRRGEPVPPPEPDPGSAESARAEARTAGADGRRPRRLATWPRRTAAVLVVAAAGVGSLYAFAPDSLDLPLRAETAPTATTTTAGAATGPPPAPASPIPSPTQPAVTPTVTPGTPAAPPVVPPDTGDPGALGGIATQIQKAPQVAPTPTRPPRVAVAATGDVNLTGSAESLLVANLGRYGVRAEDRAVSGAVAAVADRGLTDQLRQLRAAGFDYLVRAEVQVVGQREVSPYGRTETLYTARWTVHAVALANGSSLGRWDDRMEYGVRNAESEAESVLAPWAAPISDAVFVDWATRGGSIP